MPKRIYLAGPEVFLPNARELGAEKKRICEKAGLEGAFPLDTELKLDGLKPHEAGLAISRSNEKLMRSCDLIIANMTPFRGPSMDVGTAFEMGFMRALGRPVYGYANTTELFAERTRRLFGGSKADDAGVAIEDFDMVDNLMLDGAVISSGATVVVRKTDPACLLTDLTAFNECVALATLT